MLKYFQEDKTEQQIIDMMENDGNGTCYDKTSYQDFIAQNQEKYVLKIKEGGSATKANQINDCASYLRQPKKLKQLKNMGGYASRSATSKCDASKIIISSITMIPICILLKMF